jgi:sugar/nucleoside kinase (ribokinase family)
VAATRDLFESLSSDRPTVLYADIEAGSDSGSAVLQASPVLATTGPSVWNVGQVTQLADVEQWLEGIALPEYATIQVSLGDSSVTAAELRSTYQLISSAAHQALVVTLGSNGAAWADADATEVIAADSVANAFTLGAGAVFASSLVLALVSDDSRPSVGTMVSNAVVEASRYVRDATLSRDLRGLDHW